MRSLWLVTLAALLGTLTGAARLDAADARKPNVLVIVGDDMGYADVGAYGCKDIPTPHINSLAAHGVRCTSGYVSGPYCSPTRAGLMTGRYQTHFGHEWNGGGGMFDQGKAQQQLYFGVNDSQEKIGPPAKSAVPALTRVEMFASFSAATVINGPPSEGSAPSGSRGNFAYGRRAPRYANWSVSEM